MTNIIEQSFSINLSILQFFCLYPSEKISQTRTVKAYFMYFICTILIPSLSISYYLLEKEIDIKKLNINTGALLNEAIWDIIKFLPFLKNGARLKKCINYFGHPYFAPKTSHQKEIMDACIYTCRRNTMVFLVILVAGLIFWIAKPFFGNENFPIEIWLPINSRENINVYYVIYIFVSLTMVYIAIAGTIVSPLTGGMALHAAIQIQILKENLQKLGENIDTITSSEKSIGEYLATYSKIKQCINHHSAILSFAKEFQDCFSIVIFSQVLSTVISMCFCWLQLIIVQSFTLNSVLAAFCIFGLLMQLYFYCYYGTMLYEENNSLTTAIYMGEWYEYDVKSRKALILLMERSKIPLIIKAGKIIELSVNTFTGVLKKSYSLLALFKNIY